MQNAQRRTRTFRPASILVAFFIFVSLSSSVFAASVSLAWDASPEATVVGYNVYRSTTSGVAGTVPVNSTLLTATTFTDSVTNSGSYYYTVRAVSVDGAESAPSNELTVNISTVQVVQNAAPIVNAGADQAITLPSGAVLSATATDDGLPNNTLQYTWSAISGGGVSATLANPNAASTAVSFPAAGTYTFRITVSDGLLSSGDDVVISVSAASLPAPTGLVSACSADAKTFSIKWNPVAGAAAYALRVDNWANNANGEWFITDGVDFLIDAYPTVSFTGPVVADQNYSWWVHAVNASGTLGPSDGATFTCATPATNAAPVVSAGSDQTVTFPNTIILSASATDDGLPNHTLSYQWTALSGSGVNLSSPASASTQASFPTTGTYVFRVSVSDGEKSSSDDITVTVKAPSGPLSVPTGLASKCSADGKLFTISWSPASGAVSYYVRVDYVPNNYYGTWYVADSVDYLLDAYTETSFTGNAIPGQNYAWWVHAADAAGTLSNSASATFTCTDTTKPESDTTPPSVSITSPSDGVVITGRTINIVASASDNVRVAGVQFLLNGAKLGNELTVTPYSLAWNTKKQGPGKYVLEAVARDAAGNRTTSAPVTVTVGKIANSVDVKDGRGKSLSGNETSVATVGYAVGNLSSDENGLAIITLEQDGDIVSETAVAPSRRLSEGRVYVRVNSSVNTGIAMANDSDKSAVVSFYFTDQSGVSSTGSTFTIEARHSLTAFVTQAPFNLNTPMEGTLTFTSSEPVAVVGLQGVTNERGEFLMATLPASPLETAATTRTVVPQFAAGGGWSTEIVLVNPTDAPLSGTVEFVGNGTGATPGCVKCRYALAPRAAIRLQRAVNGGDARSGYVLITAAGGTALPQALGILSLSRDGVMVSQASIAAIESAASLSAVIDEGASVHAGMALANASASPLQVTLELTSIDDPGLSFTTTMDLAGGAHVAKFLAELFPGISEEFEGTLHVSASGPVAAAGLRLRTNGRGDTLISTTPFVDATSPRTASPPVFPLFVSGHGYFTIFIGR